MGYAEGSTTAEHGAALWFILAVLLHSEDFVIGAIVAALLGAFNFLLSFWYGWKAS